jgi:hypothetical protein
MRSIATYDLTYVSRGAYNPSAHSTSLAKSVKEGMAMGKVYLVRVEGVEGVWRVLFRYTPEKGQTLNICFLDDIRLDGLYELSFFDERSSPPMVVKLKQKNLDQNLPFQGAILV